MIQNCPISLRQMQWGVQNGSITKNRVLPSNYFFFFRKFCLSLRTSYNKSWFNVPTAQMSIFILFISSEVLSELVFFPVFSENSPEQRNKSLLLPLETTSIPMYHVLGSQLFKETPWIVQFYFTDLPLSAMICRPDFPCFVSIHLHAFSRYVAWVIFFW